MFWNWDQERWCYMDEEAVVSLGLSAKDHQQGLGRSLMNDS